MSVRVLARRSMVLARRSMVLARRSMVLARNMVLARRSMVLARRSMVLARRSMVLARRSMVLSRRSMGRGPLARRAWYLFRMRRLWIFVVMLVAALTPAAARARGRLPAADAVIFDPHDAKTIYVRATFGLLVSHDGGSAWSWICDRAIGGTGTGAELPSYAVTPKGTLLAAASSGLSVSRDGGCTFAFAGGPNAHVLVDLAVRPDGEVVGVMSAPPKSGAAPPYDNHLVVSKDDAQTFAASGGAIDKDLAINAVAIAPSDPARVYLIAARGEDKRAAALLVSYDAGLSWVERTIDLTAVETSASLAAVDPKSGDRVYVRTAAPADARTRLLVTEDAGKTWKKIFDAESELPAFALADDGRLFAGSREGAFASPGGSPAAIAFVKGSSVEMQCLGLAGATLWACSTDRRGFFLGSSRNGGRSFEPRLHLEEIKGPLECPPESTVTKQCAAEWPKLRRELGLPEDSASTKMRNVDTGAPALRGRETRTSGRSRTGFGAVAIVALVGLAGYSILKRLRRR